jgi:hypothetical protein
LVRCHIDTADQSAGLALTSCRAIKRARRAQLRRRRRPARPVPELGTVSQAVQQAVSRAVRQAVSQAVRQPARRQAG